MSKRTAGKPSNPARAAINIAASLAPSGSVAAQPRARGHVAVSVAAGARGTELAGLRQSGSFRALFPRKTSEALPLVLVNTAGGLTGGDRFELDLEVAPHARLAVTTQAAERAYRAPAGTRATVRTHLRVAAGGRLDWLPQETILFARSALDRSLRIDLSGDARLLIVEPLVFGRAASGEMLTKANLADRVDIHRDGTPLYLDRIHLRGDLVAQFARPGIGAGAAALASLVYAAPDADLRLEEVRSLLPNSGGASPVRDGLLVLRLLAADSFLLRKALIPVLTLLSGDDMPRPWMI